MQAVVAAATTNSGALGWKYGPPRGDSETLNNWIEVSAENLAANFRVLQAAAGGATEVLAVVKANAYGHGAAVCSVALARAGARWLGVTSATEGAAVRRALAAAGCGHDTKIMVMSGSQPEDAAAIQEYGLTPVVWTDAQIDALAGTGAAVHVEVDTGMGRQGVRGGDELARVLARVSGAGLALDGVLTHFCSSEEAASDLTQAQERLFEQAVAQVKAAGLRPAWVHAGNSSTIDNPAQQRPWLEELAATVGARAMVRSGLALYGYCLPIEGDAAAVAHVQAALRPVMSWKAKVLSVRDLAAGETVGYNATFRAQHAMRVALLPVGYADGLRRELSSQADGGGGWVMLRGQRAAILGRVSMNLTVVDVTRIAGAAAGDEAVLLGEGVTADDQARLAGTIAYEILCGVHPCG
jgi:alanine racemase